MTWDPLYALPYGPYVCFVTTGGNFGTRQQPRIKVGSRLVFICGEHAANPDVETKWIRCQEKNTSGWSPLAARGLAVFAVTQLRGR
ncbi:hypothetical protein GW17_00039089 [Ensete ventricosum]|nr:hypothetical protein GW17_00039089 [Ensete ventricosum]